MTILFYRGKTGVYKLGVRNQQFNSTDITDPCILMVELFYFAGEEHYIDSNNIVYDKATLTPIGKWNHQLRTWEDDEEREHICEGHLADDDSELDYSEWFEDADSVS